MNTSVLSQPSKEMIHMKYMDFSLKNYLALNFQKVCCPPPQAWHAVKHAFKLLRSFTATFGLLMLQLSTPVLIRRLLFLWHKLARMRGQIKRHVPVLASNCASACKISLSFSPSLHIYASSPLWEDIQRYLARHRTWLEMQMHHTGRRGAGTQAHLPLRVSGEAPCVETTPPPRGETRTFRRSRAGRKQRQNLALWF